MAYMKALRYFSKNQQVELVERPLLSNPDPGHVIIRVSFCGVCGTDLHVIDGVFPAGKEITPGHEFSGIIHEVGERVEDLQVGDRVAVDPNSGCGSCQFCKQGQYIHCLIGGLRSTIGLHREGAWAELCLVPARQVYKISNVLSLEQAILCEPMSCVLHGWYRNGLVRLDARILVMGTGITGLLWACLFHTRGYRDVTISEISEERRLIANNLSLGYAIEHPEKLQKLYQQTDPEIQGFDVVVDCTGNCLALQNAFHWLKRGGVLNVFGGCPQGETIKLSAIEFMTKEVTITSTLGNPFTYQEAVGVAEAMVDRYLDLQKLGIKLFKLDDFERAFEELRSGKISKAIFKIAD